MPTYNCLHHQVIMSERLLDDKIQPYCLECRKVELVAEKMKEYMENEESNLKNHKQEIRSAYISNMLETLLSTFILAMFFFIPALLIYLSFSPVWYYILISLIILIVLSPFLYALFTIPDFSTIYSKPKEEDIFKSVEKEKEQNETEVIRYTKKVHEEYLIRSTRIAEVDLMTGWEFEQFVANLLRNLGFTKVNVTKKTGDGGVDILAINPDGEKTAIQCKRVKGKVGFKAIQEIYLGKKINRFKKGMIITNSYYTKPALEAGAKEKLDLWCRNRLMDEMRKVDPQFHWDDYLRLFYVLPTGKQQIS